MKKVGIHKRDILVDRVEKSRDAQAIGSLKGEFPQLQKQIKSLIGEMNRAIASSNDFLAELK